MQFKYFSINEIQRFINENSLAINKKYGQNFLINAGVIDHIVKNANLSKTDLVIEIGCGLGSLTHKILESGCDLLGVEIDRGYITNLKDQFGGNPNFTLIEGDFLKKIDEIEKYTQGKNYNKIEMLGNIPYNITTPIMAKIFESKINYNSLIFMTQKEVAERIIAKENCKSYGRLSIFCQIFTEPRIIAEISPRSFYPKPKVDSSVILFKKRKKEFDIKDKDLFFKIVRSLFMNRRKQIKNNLLKSPLLNEHEKSCVLKALENADISLNIRGEKLSIEKIVLFVNEVYKLVKF